MIETEIRELDELLTQPIPEVDPTVQGPFIKHRNMMSQKLSHAEGIMERDADTAMYGQDECNN